MRLVFRQAGNHKPVLEVKGVDFIEPLPTHIRFTAVGYEGVQEIAYVKKKLSWGGNTYDFVEAFDN